MSGVAVGIAFEATAEGVERWKSILAPEYALTTQIVVPAGGGRGHRIQRSREDVVSIQETAVPAALAKAAAVPLSVDDWIDGLSTADFVVSTDIPVTDTGDDSRAARAISFDSLRGRKLSKAFFELADVAAVHDCVLEVRFPGHLSVMNPRYKDPRQARMDEIFFANNHRERYRPERRAELEAMLGASLELVADRSDIAITYRIERSGTGFDATHRFTLIHGPDARVVDLLAVGGIALTLTRYDAVVRKLGAIPAARAKLATRIEASSFLTEDVQRNVFAPDAELRHLERILRWYERTT